ncbi:hypothetical protein H5P28_09505 [Ruficoccus amylovorans]|uniref:LysE family translocator n=1 Tax=Ruficoccus amylovorans TaxID=1804625 RepID=A0A842HDH9_9BACT|nr:hypothetical protein [Ruficoccus amylovorans]MBC2594492.1 hypothetical protein [Ruficoccus amylovorans]
MTVVLLKGFVLGFIFSVIMVPGTVWCVQVTRRYGLRAGLAAALGITLGQGAWITTSVALMAVLWMLPLQSELTWIFRVLAALTLVYMALVMFRARRADSLDCPVLPGGASRIFRGTMAVSMGMPMRFFGYMAFCVAAGLEDHLPNQPGHALMVVVGAVCGTAVWWLYMVTLARVFGRRVPERISLRSINKLNPLGGGILLLVAVMTLLPLLARG